MLGGLSAGLVGALIVGLVGRPVSVTIALIGGLIGGLTKTEPVEEVSWSWPRSALGLVLGLVLGLTIGMISRLAFPAAVFIRLLVLIGLISALSVGLTTD